MIRVRNKNFYISRIVRVYRHKRFFCILDQKLPYELIIDYEKLNTYTTVNPVFIFNGNFGFTTSSYIDPETSYKFRMTEEESISEYNRIKNIINCYEEKILEEAENEKSIQISSK